MAKRQDKDPQPSQFSPWKPVLQPEDLLEFVELPAFTRRWKELGLDDEEDLASLQLQLMNDPKAGKPIKATKAIRKLRFAPRKWNTGKRGATRVLYVYFEELGFVLLCLIYGKGEVDDISDGVKKQLNQLVNEVELELFRRMEFGQE